MKLKAPILSRCGSCIIHTPKEKVYKALLGKYASSIWGFRNDCPLPVSCSSGHPLPASHHFRFNVSRKLFSWRRKIARVKSAVCGSFACKANESPLAVVKPGTGKNVSLWDLVNAKCTVWWWKIHYFNETNITASEYLQPNLRTPQNCGSVLDITFFQQVRQCNKGLERGAWRNCGEMQSLLQTYDKWQWIIKDLLKSKDINWNSKMSNKMTIFSCIIYQLWDHMVVDLRHDGVLAHLQ